jgi:hypothetical protein
MDYLNKIKNLYIEKNIKINKNKPYAACIIEPRNDPILELVIYNFMYYLSDNWSLYIFHGTDNEQYVKNITKNMGDIYYHNLNVKNLTIRDYNKLCTSIDFYKQFHCDKILIFQLDTLLRKKIPIEYMQYDYVGAPWKNKIVGNGGLSLRDKRAMIDVLSKFPFIYNENEDYYFAKVCLMFNKKIPTFDIACKFSIECVWNDDPIGMHNPHIYNFPSYEKFLELLKI